jgi:bifunctional enzyme CysN/CysC
MARASRQRGDPYLDLALLTDGLRAEREQGITIDVAYRYFATAKRKFIIADTPGHIQYTRNMVTGASTAELAIVLIDARNGVITQSRRHGFLASLLQIPHILVAVNKMDLVDYSQDVFQAIVDDYRAFASKLTVQDITYIPISALRGDNVVHKSEAMPWYEGPTLMHHLENVTVGSSRNLVDFRFPCRWRCARTRTSAALPGRSLRAASCRARRWWCCHRARQAACAPSPPWRTTWPRPPRATRWCSAWRTRSTSAAGT